MNSGKSLALLGVLTFCCASICGAADKTSRGAIATQAQPDRHAVRWATAILRTGAASQSQPVIRAQAPDVASAAAAAAPAAPAAPEPGNLWTFLGFPNKKEMAVHKEAISRMPLKKVLDGATKPLLKVVGLVPGPPPLEAPVNPDIKALGTAAKIKEEENLVPAKIQAIKYLAKIGCGCYEGVEEALLASLNDCNEKVRREAVKALGKGQCCSQKVLETLGELAYGTDDYGQPKEPSEKVRKEAIKVIEKCTCEAPLVPEPEVTPEPEVVPEEPSVRPETPMPEQAFYFEQEGEGRYGNQPGRRALSFDAAGTYPVSSAGVAARRRVAGGAHRDDHDFLAASPTPSSGRVEFVDMRNRLVRVVFEDGGAAPVGTRFLVFHKYPFKVAHIGDLEIVESADGVALARPLNRKLIRKVSMGDEISLDR